MNRSRTLFTYHDLTVEVEDAPGEELIEHMHSTVLGQPGGLRYQHTNLVERLTAPGENYFIYLRKSGKMLGSVGFCGKPAATEGTSYDSWLIRYFSIKAPMRSVSKRRRGKDLKHENRRNTLLYRFSQPVFANPSQLRDGEQDTESPAVIYGIIDQANLPSLNFSEQMGMETVSEMAGFSFNRFRPGRSGRAEQLSSSEYDSMRKLLDDFYCDYNLFFPDPLFKNGDYYVIKDSGRIVAGLQIYHVTWRIVDFGGGVANGAVRILTRIPWFKKRINPDKFKLLAVDGIYCEQGYETALYELMEDVLARTDTYVAMLMMDVNSSLYKIFKKEKKLGVLNRIVGTFKAEIRVRFINLPESVKKAIRERPTYIPTYDNS